MSQNITSSSPRLAQKGMGSAKQPLLFHIKVWLEISLYTKKLLGTVSQELGSPATLRSLPQGQLLFKGGPSAAPVMFLAAAVAQPI